MNLVGKKIVITGASQGIGRALAVKLAKKGNEIVILSRNADALESLSRLIDNSGGKAYYTSCDVGSRDSMVNAINFAVEKMGAIDCGILNAGVSYKSGFTQLDINGVLKMFAVNVFGIIYALELLVPVMMKQKEGTIVGVSSLAEARGFLGNGFYAGTKAAVSNILEFARIDLSETNIKIITVKPGFVKTNMTADNDYWMPMLMDAGKAADIIISGIEAGKRIIAFPLPMALLSTIGKIIPSVIYEKFVKMRK